MDPVARSGQGRGHGVHAGAARRRAMYQHHTAMRCPIGDVLAIGQRLPIVPLKSGERWQLGKVHALERCVDTGERLRVARSAELKADD